MDPRVLRRYCVLGGEEEGEGTRRSHTAVVNAQFGTGNAMQCNGYLAIGAVDELMKKGESC